MAMTLSKCSSPEKAPLLPRGRRGAVQVIGEDGQDDLVDEGRFSRARNARDGGHEPRRHAHRDPLQVVLAAVGHFQPPAVRLLPDGRDFDLPAPRQKVARDGARLPHDILDGAAGDDFAAVDARLGSDVHDIVGGAHGVLVVFDDDERVAEVAQPLQGGEQLFVVALVQPDARLVEDIEHPRQRAADLRREADALALAAREGGGAPGEREIVQTHARQEVEAVCDLL